MNPFFSADSRSIGFLSPTRGLIRVSIDGGPPIKMVDAPRRNSSAPTGPPTTRLFIRRAEACTARPPAGAPRPND